MTLGFPKTLPIREAKLLASQALGRAYKSLIAPKHNYTGSDLKSDYNRTGLQPGQLTD